MLVDEFQDTNAAQWAIIRRIGDPGAAGLPVRRRRSQAEHLRLSRRGRQRVRARARRDRASGAAGRSATARSAVTRRVGRLLQSRVRAPARARSASAVSDYEVEFGDGDAGAPRRLLLRTRPLLELLLLDNEAGQRRRGGAGGAALGSARARPAHQSNRRSEQRPIYDKQRADRRANRLRRRGAAVPGDDARHALRSSASKPRASPT